MITLSYTYPILLLSIPCIILLWYGVFRENIGIIPPNALLKQYLKTPVIIWWLWVVRSFIVTFSVLLLTQAYIHTSGIKEESVPHEVTLVLDISRSMLAEDITPNRINVAKNSINSFLLGRIGNRISMVIFAGKPFLSISKSDDITGMLRFIEHIHPSMILQEKPGLSGTNIGDALLLASTTFSPGASGKTLILITDGNANTGTNPEQAAQHLAEHNISLYTIGIGGKTGEPLFYTDSNGQKNYFFDQEGNRIYNDLDEAFLTRISNITGGGYFSAHDSQTLNTILDTIQSKIPPKTHLSPYRATFSLDVYFFGALIFCSGVEYILRARIRKKYLQV